ncbi:MAG: hypothetical protein AB8B56_00300, partial [Crocinitomicaceae bacterium]
MINTKPTPHVFNTLLLLTIFLFVGISSFAQLCPFTFTSFGTTGTAPAPGGANVNIGTCEFPGDYQTINGIVAGNQYTVNATGAPPPSNITHLVLYDIFFTPILSGPPPFTFTA